MEGCLIISNRTMPKVLLWCVSQTNSKGAPCIQYDAWSLVNFASVLSTLNCEPQSNVSNSELSSASFRIDNYTIEIIQTISSSILQRENFPRVNVATKLKLIEQNLEKYLCDHPRARTDLEAFCQDTTEHIEVSGNYTFQTSTGRKCAKSIPTHKSLLKFQDSILRNLLLEDMNISKDLETLLLPCLPANFQLVRLSWMAIQLQTTNSVQAQNILLCNTSNSSQIKQPCCNWESVFQHSANEGNTTMLTSFFQDDWASILRILRIECEQASTSDSLIVLANPKHRSVLFLSVLDSNLGLCTLFDLKFNFVDLDFPQAFACLLSHIGSCSTLNYTLPSFEKPMKTTQANSNIGEVFKQCGQRIQRHCVLDSSSTSVNLDDCSKQKGEEIVRKGAIVNKD